MCGKFEAIQFLLRISFECLDGYLFQEDHIYNGKDVSCPTIRMCLRLLPFSCQNPPHFSILLRHRAGVCSALIRLPKAVPSPFFNAARSATYRICCTIHSA